MYCYFNKLLFKISLNIKLLSYVTVLGYRYFNYYNGYMKFCLLGISRYIYNVDILYRFTPGSNHILTESI